MLRLLADEKPHRDVVRGLRRKLLNVELLTAREAQRQPTDSRRRNFEPGEGDRNVLLGGGLFDYFSPSSTPS